MAREKAEMNQTRCVLAVVAHPDDIEFYMAGTLLLLRQRGWHVHYLNIADGCCGTETLGRDELARIRRDESIAAAQRLGATYHESMTRDMEVFYTRELLARVTAVVREAAPEIVLTLSPQDYMEDHQNACRLAVGAAFSRGIPNLVSEPPHDMIRNCVTVYHAVPHSNRDSLRRLVRSGLYVDIGAVLDEKSSMLACHRSQKEWLDASQGMSCYLEAMRELACETGLLSGRYASAEGWRRHAHAGFCAQNADPLREALADLCFVDERYEQGLGE